MPLAEALRKRGHEVFLYGKGPALNVYGRSGLAGEEMIRCTQEEIKGFVEKGRFDAVMTGTSAEDRTERFIWKAAAELGVPSLAVLDQWINYGIRFSEYGISEREKYLKDKRHPYLPDKVLVMDELARKEAVKEGLEEARIVITGQPHFEAVVRYAKRLSLSEREAARAAVGAEATDTIVAFASEPISQDYGKDGRTPYLGYDEKSVLTDISETLLSLLPLLKEKVIVVVKPHPRENTDNFSRLPAELAGGRIRFKVTRTIESLLLASVSDVVCGMSSMFLIESAILGKPVISVQTGLSAEDPFVLSKIGATRTATDREALEKALKKAIVDRTPEKIGINFIADPIERVVSLAEECACRN